MAPKKVKQELKSWIYYAIIEVAEQYQITYGDINETLIDLLKENTIRDRNTLINKNNALKTR